MGVSYINLFLRRFPGWTRKIWVKYWSRGRRLRKQIRNRNKRFCRILLYAHFILHTALFLFIMNNSRLYYCTNGRIDLHTMINILFGSTLFIAIKQKWNLYKIKTLIKIKIHIIEIHYLTCYCMHTFLWNMVSS